MNIDFRKEFIDPIDTNVTDKYLNEYLQTSRYNLLLFNDYNYQLYTLQNNYLVNDNKHLYQFIDTTKRDNLQYELKQLILKQRKLYQQFIHYYTTSVNTSDINNKDAESITYATLGNTEHNTKSIRSKDLQSIENKRELQLQQNLLTSTSIIHKINNILNKKAKIDSDDHTIDTKHNTNDTKHSSDFLTRGARSSIDSKRSVFTISSRKSTDSNKSTDSISNNSKKSYKINRPEKQEVVHESKKNTFTKFFIKKNT